MIDIEKLRFGYGAKGWLFDDFSLTVRRGEAWTLIGPSGCGKTSLLYLVAGLNMPLGGTIRICDQLLKRPRPSTGLVLQDHGLLPWATVEENTRLGQKIRGFYGPDGKHCPEDVSADSARDKERIDYWLDWLGIDKLRKMYPGQLSRGQRQRAAIARTLVLEPDLLLMDEPFSALDAPIREELQKVMNNFHRQSGLTSLTVTHDIEEAVVLGEKILVLGNGCNTHPVVIDNPLSGVRDDRQSPEFLATCRRLRQLIIEQGGLESVTVGGNDAAGGDAP